MSHGTEITIKKESLERRGNKLKEWKTKPPDIQIELSENQQSVLDFSSNEESATEIREEKLKQKAALATKKKVADQLEETIQGHPHQSYPKWNLW